MSNVIKNSVSDNFSRITTGMDIFSVELDKIDSSPEDWNFYKPLNDSKLLELIESILENGLLTAVIVWAKGDGKYMMLAGHNRLKAYRMIYERTGDVKYKKIHCHIKKKDEITEEEAKIIIIDTNFVQRQLSTLEKTKSIVYKYQSLGRKKRNSEGKSSSDIIAEDYGLKRSQVFNYLKLQSLIPEITHLIDSGIISIDSGVRLSKLSSDIQNKLYENNLGVLNNTTIKKIDSLDYLEIISQIKKVEENDEYEIFKIKVPTNYSKCFEEFLHKWEHYKVIILE